MSTGEPVDEQESSSSQSSSAEQVDDLRADLTAKVAALLAVDDEKARKIVEAFDAQIARPIEKKFAALQPHDLTKRNPYFHAVLGTTSVDDWVERALADLETSALESHVGKWLEDVARIVSGGFKPGSGVDVQRQIGDDTVELYSLQMAGNTKSSGGSQAEIANLQRAAAPLRTHGGMRVTTIVGVMYGRKSFKSPGADPNILKPSSTELWERLTGQKDFLPRLLRVSRLLSALVSARARDEAERLKVDAARIFAADDGTLDLGKLIEPPPRPRRRGQRRTRLSFEPMDET
jgi:Type II restriction endonuclease EcoO109I